MLLQDCSWKDVEDRLGRDQRIVIVLGATEEHSDLSLCTDTTIPYEIARRACEQEDVLLAPPMPFGISTWSLAYPGTVSLRTTTLCAVVEDMVASLGGAGFRKLFVLNGHGFNRAVSPVFGEAIAGFEGGEVFFLQWWELEGVREVARDLGLPYGHANWSEAFPMTVLGERRSARPATSPPPNLLQSPEAIRAQLGPGHAPGPVQLEAEVMARLLEAAVASFGKVLAAHRPSAPESPSVG